MCEHLRRRIEAHDWGRIAPGLQVTVSIGTAAGPGGSDAADLGSLIEQADAVMYGAKLGGRNRVC